MNPLNRNLGLVGAGMGLFVLLVVGMTQSVVYKPFGVPESRREDYDNMLAKIALKNELLKSSGTKKRPVAAIKERVHDFGMLDPHTTAEHRFVVTNSGDDPLALEVQQTSCKCTTGKLVDGLVPPGESTEITLTWNTGYEAETYEQTAIIKTNDPIRDLIELTVKGTVRNELTVPQTVQLPGADPTVPASESFYVHSQLWDSFEVTDVRATDLESFSWFAQPVATDVLSSQDIHARSVWKVTIEAASIDYGAFHGSIDIDIQPNTGIDAITKTIPVHGKVRSAISFIGPALHPTSGFELGTVNSGKEIKHVFGVRIRGPIPEKFDVLDVEPKELKATLSPTRQAGRYQLTLVVPADCPTVMFNRPDRRGFVQVGDPDHPEFNNWFPIIGCVAELE